MRHHAHALSASKIHTIAMAFLFVMLGTGVSLFYLFIGNPGVQYKLVLTCSIFYFLWGVVYHGIKGDFHLKIVVEYFLISLFAVLLIRGAIFH